MLVLIARARIDTRSDLVARGKSPLSMDLELASAAASYRVTAEPSSEEAQENFQPTEVRYDRDGLLRAAGVIGSPPRAGGEPAPPPAGPLRVTVQLRQRDSAPMNAMLPVYHPREGWLALRTRLRSYRSLVEGDGAAPEQVAPLSSLSAVGAAERLGTQVGVWGLDVSAADGGRIVTSVFTPSADGLELEHQDAEAAARLARVEPDQRSRARVRSDYRFPIETASLVSLRLTGLTEVRLTSDGH